MTEQEAYLFDLQGYLVVPNALSSAELTELNALFDRRIKGESDPEAPKQRFLHLLTWGEVYRRLIDNPRITPYLEELIGPEFRLDHDYADLIRSGKGPTGTMLHGGGTPFDSSMFFSHHDGKMYNGMTAVAYYLRDVNPGDGGFGCVPGSHKANYPFPQEWRNLEEMRHPCVRPVTGPAGTGIIFTEALTHGTLPWRAAWDRRTLFYKYSPPAISWSAHYYDANEYDGLTRRQRQILEPPNARYGGRHLYLPSGTTT